MIIQETQNPNILRRSPQRKRFAMYSCTILQLYVVNLQGRGKFVLLSLHKKSVDQTLAGVVSPSTEALV